MTADQARGRKNILVSFLSRKELVLALRIILGAIFIFASYDKILNPHLFAIAVREYKIIPVEFSNIFALMLAWSEMVAGVLIVLGIFSKKAASALFILTAMFLAAIIISLIRGMRIDCGCFKSQGGHPVDFWLMIRDFLILLGAFLVIRFDRGFISIGRLFSRSKVPTN